jgi:hypothetical protein
VPNLEGLFGGADGTRTRDPRRDRPSVEFPSFPYHSYTYTSVIAPLNVRKCPYNSLMFGIRGASNGAGASAVLAQNLSRI